MQKRLWLPRHGTGPGWLPRPGDTETNGAAATAEVEQKVGVHLRRGGERGMETYIWRKQNTVAQYIKT